MRALVLDFDGVISNSAREAFALATRTYRDLEPGTTLDLGAPATFRAFVGLMPLGNRAEDFGAGLAAIEQGEALADQTAYDRFRAGIDPDWLDRFHRRFYEVRALVADGDPAGWRALVEPYPAFLDLLRRRTDDARYAIATARDRRSVLALLDGYGVSDLFPAALVLDKEVGRHKTEHLTRLAEALDLAFDEMTFVDDKVNHLDTVASLGVRCALAAWGYNGPREHDEARTRGHLVLTLADAEAQLFG